MPGLEPVEVAHHATCRRVGRGRSAAERQPARQSRQSAARRRRRGADASVGGEGRHQRGRGEQFAAGARQPGAVGIDPPRDRPPRHDAAAGAHRGAGGRGQARSATSATASAGSSATPSTRASLRRSPTTPTTGPQFRRRDQPTPADSFTFLGPSATGDHQRARHGVRRARAVGALGAGAQQRRGRLQLRHADPGREHHPQQQRRHRHRTTPTARCSSARPASA